MAGEGGEGVPGGLGGGVSGLCVGGVVWRLGWVF